MNNITITIITGGGSSDRRPPHVLKNPKAPASDRREPPDGRLLTDERRPGPPIPGSGKGVTRRRLVDQLRVRVDSEGASVKHAAVEGGPITGVESVGPLCESALSLVGILVAAQSLGAVEFSLAVIA